MDFQLRLKHAMFEGNLLSKQAEELSYEHWFNLMVSHPSTFPNVAYVRVTKL